MLPLRKIFYKNNGPFMTKELERKSCKDLNSKISIAKNKLRKLVLL